MEGDLAREPTVLIVEDEADLADMYYTWLKDEYHVEAYLSGRDAIDRLRPDIDVILLDRRIPDVSGDEILYEIRNMRLPAYVVMVTAVEPDESILEMDFDDYLVKPVGRQEIVSAVERMLERQQHDERLRELFQIVSKLSTLEAKMGNTDRPQSESYRELESRFERLWEELTDEAIVDELYQSGTLEKLEAAISRMDTAE